MTIYKNQVINPEKPWSFMDDTKENILKDLAEYILDPVFEEYGNFVYMPTWCDEEAAEKYKGLTAISGNFLNLSHAFSLLTDDEELIKELTEAIRKLLVAFGSCSKKLSPSPIINNIPTAQMTRK